MTLEKHLRHVADFPQEGVDFIDITPVLRDRELLRRAIDEMADLVRNLDFDFIVGAESRGFIFGTALALKLNRGFIPVRKPGKLPADIYSIRYEKEYGVDELEMHRDGLKAGDKALLIDDLLATGGTAEACARLIRKAGAEVVALLFFIELTKLEGRRNLDPELSVLSLLKI